MNSSEGLRGFVTFLILLAILTTGTVGFSYISTPTNTTSQADEPKTEPLNVSVGNLTESTATISWASINESSTQIIYSTNLKAACLSAIEDSSRDCEYTKLSEPKTSHEESLISLNPDTTYFFRIISNGKLYPTDKNHSFRTESKISEPSATNSPKSSSNDEFEGFGDVNTDPPQVNKLNSNQDQVLGISDENVSEPVDPLGDIDKMMQEEFKEAMIYNDLRKDFNKDGKVTMADYPLFIEFVVNYEE